MTDEPLDVAAGDLAHRAGMGLLGRVLIEATELPVIAQPPWIRRQFRHPVRMYPPRND